MHPSSVDLPQLTRAWLTDARFPEAAARLRTVAPGPVPRVDLAALQHAVDLAPGAVSRADVLRAIGLAAARHPDPAVARALCASVDVALDAMYP